MPKISVIVPVYKVEKYLNRCVDSILAQTLSDFELILVDDGSPDNCGIICDDYQSKDNRVVVIHKENGGLSDARNKGIERALSNGESEWITFIDSDDYVNERYLELLFSAAINNQVDLSCCGLKKFNGDSAVGEFDGEYNVFIAEPDILIAENHPFERYNISVAWARLYKKELFNNVRFPFGKLHEDEFTTYKLLYGCKNIAVVDAALYYYFENGSGITGSGASAKKAADKLNAFYEQVEYFYSNKFFNSFEIRLKTYCVAFEYFKEKDGEDYFTIIKDNKKRIYEILKNCRDALPYLLKKYGYGKWISGKAARAEGFKADVKQIKSQKGWFYSIIWAFKNFWR